MTNTIRFVSSETGEVIFEYETLNDYSMGNITSLAFEDRQNESKFRAEVVQKYKVEGLLKPKSILFKPKNNRAAVGRLVQNPDEL